MEINRRGLISSILERTVEELVEEMFNNPALANKIKLYRKNENMNKDTIAHATLAHNLFMKLRKEKREEISAIRKAAKQEKTTKEQRIAKWNEENTKSFRYRSVSEIVHLITKYPECRTSAIDYTSNTGSRRKCNPEMIERITKALISYYIVNEPYNKRIYKLIDKLSNK